MESLGFYCSLRFFVSDCSDGEEFVDGDEVVLLFCVLFYYVYFDVVCSLVKEILVLV